MRRSRSPSWRGPVMLEEQYRAAVARGELKPDAAQENAVAALHALAVALGEKPSLFRKRVAPKGL